MATPASGGGNGKQRGTPVKVGRKDRNGAPVNSARKLFKDDVHEDRAKAQDIALLPPGGKRTKSATSATVEEDRQSTLSDASSESGATLEEREDEDTKSDEERTESHESDESDESDSENEEKQLSDRLQRTTLTESKAENRRSEDSAVSESDEEQDKSAKSPKFLCWHTTDKKGNDGPGVFHWCTKLERSLSNDVIRHTLKDDRGNDLKCLKDTNKHVEAGKDYDRVFGEQKSFIHRLRKVLDDEGLECSPRRCRYRKEGQYNFERDFEIPHRDDDKFKGARIGIHASTQEKYLTFFDHGHTSIDSDTQYVRQLDLDKNGIFIMNMNSRHEDEAKLYHMGSCEGESVTMIYSFNRNFTDKQCKLMEDVLIETAESLYDKFVAKLPTTSTGSSKTRRIKEA